MKERMTEEEYEEIKRKNPDMERIAGQRWIGHYKIELKQCLTKREQYYRAHRNLLDFKGNYTYDIKYMTYIRIKKYAIPEKFKKQYHLSIGKIV